MLIGKSIQKLLLACCLTSLFSNTSFATLISASTDISNSLLKINVNKSIPIGSEFVELFNIQKTTSTSNKTDEILSNNTYFKCVLKFNYKTYREYILAGELKIIFDIVQQNFSYGVEKNSTRSYSNQDFDHTDYEKLSSHYFFKVKSVSLNDQKVNSITGMDCTAYQNSEFIALFSLMYKYITYNGENERYARKIIPIFRPAVERDHHIFLNSEEIDDAAKSYYSGRFLLPTAQLP